MCDWGWTLPRQFQEINDKPLLRCSKWQHKHEYKEKYWKHTGKIRLFQWRQEGKRYYNLLHMEWMLARRIVGRGSQCWPSLFRLWWILPWLPYFHGLESWFRCDIWKHMTYQRIYGMLISLVIFLWLPINDKSCI